MGQMISQSYVILEYCGDENATICNDNTVPHLLETVREECRRRSAPAQIHSPPDDFSCLVASPCEYLSPTVELEFE